MNNAKMQISGKFRILAKIRQCVVRKAQDGRKGKRPLFIN